MDQNTLSIYKADRTTLDKLKRTYGEVISQVQKGALSSILKNTELSGNPESGSVVVSRLMTAQDNDYGTARTAGKGDKVANNDVVILLDTNKEIVEEINKTDLQLHGVANMIDKRKVNHGLRMIRTLDTAFFAQAEAAGTEVTPTGSTIVAKLEDLILGVEETVNDNVDGCPREMLAVTVKPKIYSELKLYIDTLPNPSGGGVKVNYFNEVQIYSNHRQTEDAICMAVGSIGQPVVADPYSMDRIPLSKELAVELYYTFGTKAVMGDLIKYASFASPSA